MRKINLHFAIDARGTAYCERVNSGIRQITPSVIHFGEGSTMIPHISLIMGVLREGSSLEDLIATAGESFSSHRAPIVRIGPPYLEDVRGRYVFSDILNAEDIVATRQRLAARVAGIHLDVQTDYTELPHLTLGHVEDRSEEIRRYLATVPVESEIACPAVEISDVGPKGTCINSIWKMALSA
jgi:hypothetical protein